MHMYTCVYIIVTSSSSRESKVANLGVKIVCKQDVACVHCDKCICMYACMPVNIYIYIYIYITVLMCTTLESQTQ